MMFAISTESGRVCPHFGRAPQFTLIRVDNGKLIEKRIVSNPGHTVGGIPKFMKENNVDYMLTGGMGYRAQEFFNQYNIETIMGVEGSIDDVIKDILNGKIKDLGGESLCTHGVGKGFGVDKIHDANHECDE